MTNVKLKLMFFLLNSLLTADVVQARPYSDNTTDVVIKYTNSNNTFNIPVEPDSDTLVVANDDTSEQNVEEEEDDDEENDKDDLASMMNAEQDRDEVMSEMQDHSVLAEDAATVEKRKNISSPSLHEMIDSETDREESITDLMFRPGSELAEDMPRFEFLIAGRINESDVNKTAGAKNSGGRFEKNGSDMMRKADYVELVEVMKPKMSENKSALLLLNITGHEVDNDLAPDTRFTDVQTLFLACFATLLPLLAALFATLLIRSIIRRWCPGCCEKPTESSVSESSEKQDGQLKCPAEESVEGEGETPPANGSIFTMTLKNNHLIVETEERNDIARNGRETKMKYSPDNDGIFVVEVQQSTAYKPNNKCLQNATSYDTQISMNQALIHRVPEELERNTEDSETKNDEYSTKPGLRFQRTGLSISDSSMFSLESPNLSYAYGAQVGYEQGRFGYPVYTGYNTKYDIPKGIVCENSQEPLIVKTPTDPDKPIVTAAIFKQDSIIGSEVLQGPGYCIEGSTDGPLLSDVQAREYSLQHLHDQKEKKLENGVAVPISEKIASPKKVLNRADSLPVRLEEDSTPEIVIVKNNYMETIKEDDIPKEFMKGKRASLPIINTEAYEPVKDEILLSVSPELEKVANEISPCDSGFDGPPMITITEESEPGKSDSTS